MISEIEGGVKIFQEILEGANPKDIVMLSHADHDGLTSSALIDLMYFESYRELIRKFHPTKTLSYVSIFNKIISLKPKYFLIIDALVKNCKKFVERLIENGCIVINLDHHDLLSIEDENYLDLNPHNWKLEFMNSSGLCWIIAKKFDEEYFRSRCWVAGTGAIQDYCIEDNKELMEELVKEGYVKENNLYSALDSELLRIAKAINFIIHLRSPNLAYKLIFESAAENNIKRLEGDENFKKAMEIYENKIRSIYGKIKENVKELEILGKRIKFYNLKGNEISIISEICESEREKAIYIVYSNGLLGFRSLFYDYDVRKLAKLFGGGGPHPRVGGAKTRKSFDEVIREIENYMRKEEAQRTLNIL